MKRRFFKLKPEVSTSTEQFIKPKEQDNVKTGKPGDKYEVEADKAANAVISNRDNGSKDIQMSNKISKSVQLKEEAPIQAKEEEVQMAKEEEVQAQEEEEAQTKEEELQAKESKTSTKKQSKVQSSDITKHRGKGVKMDPQTQKSMERNFGVDFSAVKIHKGSYATELNKKMQSKAFTSGNDIFFKSSNYDPKGTKGKHLLAHELTHTIQQKGKSKKK